MSNLSSPKTEETYSNFTLDVVVGSKPTRVLLDEATINKYKRILANYGDSDFTNPKWKMSMVQSRSPVQMDFADLQGYEECDIAFIKSYVLYTIVLHPSSGLSTVKKERNNSKVLFDFLYSQGIFFENIVTPLLSKFVQHVASFDCTDSVKRSICSTTESILKFATEHGVLNRKTLSIEYSFEEKVVKSNPRRAPEKSVMRRLDRVFFDMSIHIPLDFRLMYLLLRLILNRFSEVQHIQLESITFPSVNIFTISIPATKGMPLSLPVYKEYHRSVNGDVEGILLKTYLMQQEYAQKHQDVVSDEEKDYLFLSSKNPKHLLGNAEFNAFLDEICKQYNIRTHNGEIAHVTSHSFRHMGIVERLDSNLFQRHDIQREAVHARFDETLGYGYSSTYDEGNHIEQLTKSIFGDDFDSNIPLRGTKHSKTISSKKYDIRMKQPYTRIIPSYGICSNISCTPKYEQCIRCNSFVPDRAFLPYFEECALIAEEKLNVLKTNERPPKEAIAFAEGQLEVYLCFISRVTEYNKKEEIG